MKSSLWNVILRTGAARVYAAGASALSMMLAARVAGPVQHGFAAAAITWVSLTGTITYLSLGQVAMHRAAQARDGLGWLSPTVASLLVMTGLFTLVGWAGAAIGYAAGVTSLTAVPGVVVLVALATLPGYLWEQYGSALLIATGHVRIQNRAQVLGRTASLAVVALLVLNGWGAIGLVAGLLVGQWVVALVGTRVLLRVAGPLRFDWGVARSLVGDGLKLHLNAIGAFLFARASLLVVQHFGGAAETGRYQAALDLVNIGMIAAQAVTTVLYSHVSTVGANEAWAQQKQIIGRLVAATTVLSLVAIVLAPIVVPLLLSDNYLPTIRPLQVLLLSLPGMVIASSMAPQWIGRGLFLHASAVTFVIGLCSVGAAALLVPRYGAVGAAWGTVAAYGLAVLINAGMAIHVNRQARLGGAALSGT